MRSFTLKIAATGRGWGNKEPATAQPAVIGGVKCTVHSSDFWEGPVASGETGQYFRRTWLEAPELDQ